MKTHLEFNNRAQTVHNTACARVQGRRGGGHVLLHEMSGRCYLNSMTPGLQLGAFEERAIFCMTVNLTATVVVM